MKIRIAFCWALLTAVAPLVVAGQTTTCPFVGVTYTARSETLPRPNQMHVMDIDLAAPGIGVRLTPHTGPLHTVKQTTLQFLNDQHAQIAINAHFFEPWPPPSPDPGAASLVGIAASDGDVYAPFMENPPKQIAIRPNAPGLNIDAKNHASIVHRNPSDATGRTVAETVSLHNTLAGNEQIITNGAVTAVETDWNNQLAPRTVIGITRAGHLILFIVDGRQPGVSEGLKTREAAEILLRDYTVVDAINLDGGGSTTLAIADPTPRLLNTPVGLDNKPNTLRPVGSSLAIFATANGVTTTSPRTSPATSATAPAVIPAQPRTVASPPSDAMDWRVVAGSACALALVVTWTWRRLTRRRS